MTNPSALRRLQRWPDLWRYPKLFALVHGATEGEPTAPQLLAALLEHEVVVEQDAWQAILRCEDIAAIQSACLVLAPQNEAKELALAREGFLRRVEHVRDRARPLSAGRAGVEAVLDEAVKSHISDPRKAERMLASATAAGAEAERRELAELAARFPTEAPDDPHLARLAHAIGIGDLRLARIYASQLGGVAAMPPAADHTQRLDREPAARLLAWRLDLGQPPAWLERIELAEHDLVALTRLEATLNAEMLSEVDAEQFIRATVRYLLSGAVPAMELKRADDIDEQTWAFRCSGSVAMRLFPHVVSQEGGTLLLVPRTNSSRAPVGPHAEGFVGWDVFESWQPTAARHVVLATPRMLLNVLPLAQGRVEAFVRMQSSAIGVRPLILQVLAGNEPRFRGMAGLSTSACQPDSFAKGLSALITALDLQVDEGDLLALSDACGDRFAWLPLVFGLIAQRLDASPVANRRFDALGALRRPDLERGLEEALELELKHLLRDKWEQTAVSLAIVEDELDRDLVPPEGVSRSQLSQALVREGHAADSGDAESQVDALLSLGLIRGIKSGTGKREFYILRDLPFPGRVLLRSAW